MVHRGHGRRLTGARAPQAAAAVVVLLSAGCDSCLPPTPLTRCDSDLECPRGFACRSKDHVCVAHCDDNADCDDGDPCNGSETCDPDRHRCAAVAASAPDQFDGTSCGAGRECRAGLCVQREQTCVVDLAAAGDHSCVATAAGNVSCWGRNSRGQLGLGDTANRLVPAAVPGIGGVLELGVGQEFSCARSASDVKCWGDNRYGQLGDGSVDQQTSPVAVLDPGDIVELAAGKEFACARRHGGQVACWGRNDPAPALGDGSRHDQSRPVLVEGIDDAIALGAGGYHACAIRADRTLWCWGANWWGQLGTGCGGIDCARPVQVAGLTSVLAVGAGEEHTCALLVDGTVWCLGGGGQGQLGTASAVDTATALVVPGLDHVVSLGVGQYFNCVRRSGGAVQCWGANGQGQLGDGSYQTRGQPQPVTLPAPALEVASASSYACVRLDNGTVHCWGDNSWGQIGNGRQTIVTSPKTVLLSASVEQIAVGMNHSCALTSADGNGKRHVLCWGSNQYGQLGNTPAGSAPVDSARPAPVVDDLDAVEIAAGSYHTCARTLAGELYCWGDNNDYQLGTGDTAARSAPVTVDLGTDRVAHIALGTDYSCALTTSGRVLCWGANGENQHLGASCAGNGWCPQPIEVINDVVELGARIWYTCARRTDGSVWCWGALSQMWLVQAQPTAVDLGALQGVAVRQLAVGGDHVCLLDADDHAWCWGRNGLGALGVPVAEQGDAYAPVAVRAAAPHDAFAVIASSWNNSCAAEPYTSGGAVYCWGANDLGELGTGDTASKDVPSVVIGLSGVVAVAAGELHTCAINGDHNAFCWGSYAYGQLGDDMHADTWVPTEVPALRCQ